MNTVLITGASRGIGLEFCRQYAERGWKVLACCRNPIQAMELMRLKEQFSTINVYPLDVMDRQDIDNLSVELSSLRIDLIVANAGIYGDQPGHAFGHLDYSNWLATFETNVMGAVKMVEAFMSQLLRSSNPRVAALSSQMGSIADNGSGGSILYRSSKAALNAAMKSIAIDLQSRGVGVMIFHPGWVQTDMGGSHALISTETSVSGMIDQVSNFSMTRTGEFIKYDGSNLPW